MVSLLMLLQLLVIMAMIFFFFPASRPVNDLKAMTIGQLHHEQPSKAATTPAAASDGPFTYNIVLDAGSTGSRIHIFKFKQEDISLNLISDGFHQLKPGLSAFPDEPQKAAESLKPLLEEAMKAVPATQQVRSRRQHRINSICFIIFIIIIIIIISISSSIRGLLPQSWRLCVMFSGCSFGGCSVPCVSGTVLVLQERKQQQLHGLAATSRAGTLTKAPCHGAWC
jgi:hypothetical protein